MRDEWKEWAAQQHEEWAANCRRAVQKTRPVEGAEFQRRAKEHDKHAMFFRSLDYPSVTEAKEKIV